MLTILGSTFGIIFLAELPDKTSLAALALATRYRARAVIAGAWLAFAVQTALALVAASLIRLLPARPVHVAAGAGFLVFAVLALRRDEAEELEEEEKEAASLRRRRLAPWLACFLVVFAAEFGDLTQLATAALVVRFGNPLVVAAGAIAALWCVTLISVTAGAQLGRFLSDNLLARLSAALFGIVGVVVIVSALV
jgi:putative Ca2+/H+ antiporter (TMEM165/GDT1 family)